MGRRKLSQDQLHKTKLIFKGNPHLFYKNDATVDFKVPKTNPSFAKAQGKPAFPVFTNDGKYYTPTFALVKLDEFKDQDCLKIHRQKVQESLRQFEEDQIMIAKPSAKSQFCGVCRTCYEDYLTHLDQAHHKKMLAESKYQKQIVGLCAQFEQCIKQPTESEIVKKNSTETKLNEDQSCTQCFIQEKKTVLCGSRYVNCQFS